MVGGEAFSPEPSLNGSSDQTRCDLSVIRSSGDRVTTKRRGIRWNTPRRKKV